jgi:DNA-binding transcriptional ArsR family regulator
MSATKPSSLDDLTVEQLEAALAAKRKSQTDTLRDKRASLLEQLKAVDKQLEAAGVGVPGAVRVGRGGRGGVGGVGGEASTTSPARRGVGAPRGPRGVPMATLVVRAILASNEKEVAVTEIVERVAKHGSSSNPKTAVGQALVKLKKAGLVDSPSRGAYRVTASGKKLAAAEAGS